MEFPYEFIKSVVETTDAILQTSKDETLGENDKVQVFMALVLAERLIDKCRVILPTGSGEKFPEDKASIDDALVRIRDEIWDYREDLDDEKVEAYLHSLGEDIKFRALRKTL